MIYAENSMKVVGVFDSREQAEAAWHELGERGFSSDELSLSQQAHEEGQQEDRGFWDRAREFFTGEEAEVYSEASRRGATLLTVETRGEARTNEAAEIIDRHGPIDVDDRAAQWRESGWHSGSGQQGRAEQATEHRGEQHGEESIPVTEEQLRVGKERQRRGGVRVYSRVHEEPVEKDVTLRDEHVHVDRREVDRPAGEDAFQERTIEAEETHEEPVVSKEARVVEEVDVRKDVDEHTEKVKDTVRKTEVEVEGTDEGRRHEHETRYGERSDTGEAAGPGPVAEAGPVDELGAAAPAGPGMAGDEVGPIDEGVSRGAGETAPFDERGYEVYRPAHDFGRQLSEKYPGRSWDNIEPQARQDFERDYDLPWDRFRDTIRDAYEKGGSR